MLLLWSLVEASPVVGQDRNDYVVVLRPGQESADAVRAAHKARYGVDIQGVLDHAVSGYFGSIRADQVARIRRDPGVSLVTLDTVIAIRDKPKAIAAPRDQVVPTGIRRIGGDLSSTRSGDGRGSVDVDVAVVDTGVDPKHPDLNVAGGVICNGSRQIEDVQGHGTFVAGIVAARDDTVGVVGVAPGARIWSVASFDAYGRARLSAMLCGIDWITANADVIEVGNLSFGVLGSDDGKCGLSDGDVFHQAICAATAAGVTLVASAGNSSTDASSNAPASYREVIAVSAMADFDGMPGGVGTEDDAGPRCAEWADEYPEEDDSFAAFSNYGDVVDMTAPGSCIFSTFLQRKYAMGDGTSFSAPHLAGAAALYISRNAGATPREVQRALTRAGTSDWDNSDDPDGIKEPLVNVSSM